MNQQPQSSLATAAGLTVSLLAIGGLAYTGLQLGFVPGMQDSLSAAVARYATLTVLSPNGGEAWTVGTTQNITWRGGDQNWKMSLLLMNETKTMTVKTIMPSVANTGSYAWPITSDIAPGRYYIRASCTNCKSNVRNRTDFSDASFTIVPNPAVPAGVSLELISTSAVADAGTSANDDIGTFTIKFKVTAIGGTVYVSSIADDTLTGVTTGKTSVQVDRAGTATDSGISVALTNDTIDEMNAAGLYEISDGESHTMTLTTSVTIPAAGTAGLFRAKLGGVSWTASSTDSTPDNAYTSSLDSFKTAYLALN